MKNMILILGLLSAVLPHSFVQARSVEHKVEGTYSKPGRIGGGFMEEFKGKASVTLLGQEIKSMQQVHDIFENFLDLPDHYGRNFDALYDVLTDEEIIAHVGSKHKSRLISVSIRNGDQLERTIGHNNYEKLKDVLQDAKLGPVFVSN
ncbi:MAG: barstar family protein [Bdellovibrio sp.]